MQSRRANAFLTAVTALMAVAALLLCPKVVLPHAATSNTVLFDREIVRILNTHCVMCHAEGSLSFPLETYEETWLRREAIHNHVLARKMPPWPAAPGYGEFSNANSLTLREQRFIVSWVEGLGPRNDGVVFLNVSDPEAASRREIAAKPNFDGWTLGEPDLAVALVLTASSGTENAGRQARIRQVTIDPGLGSETWLKALEYRPADRSSIRAAVFSIEKTGQWLATWTPWHGFRRLPENIAYRLPAGARILAELYMAEAAGAVAAAGGIGLHFGASAGTLAASETVLVASDEIPSRTMRRRIRAETRLAADTSVLALWPVLPPETESLELAARRPDGKVEILLYAREIPPDWPTPYIYETPVSFSAGTRLSLTAYVSNASADASLRRLELKISTVIDRGDEGGRSIDP